MKMTSVANILNDQTFGKNAKLSRNGFSYESLTHSFNIISQKDASGKEKVLWVNMSKLDKSDKDSRIDWNNTKQIKTLKELKSIINGL